jgi:hypothetical protein
MKLVGEKHKRFSMAIAPAFSPTGNGTAAGKYALPSVVFSFSVLISLFYILHCISAGILS